MEQAASEIVASTLGAAEIGGEEATAAETVDPDAREEAEEQDGGCAGAIKDAHVQWSGAEGENRGERQGAREICEPICETAWPLQSLTKPGQRRRAGASGMPAAQALDLRGGAVAEPGVELRGLFQLLTAHSRDHHIAASEIGERRHIAP